MYEIGEPEIEAVAHVIRSGKLFRYLDADKSEVARFEKAWAKRIGTTYALGVNSGTSSLICALVGLGVGPGDEVIVPAYTFIATPLAVLAVGAVPIIAEVDESLSMDPKDLKSKVTPRTKAIIPVHMNGHPCDMGAIMRIAGKQDLLVMEDCCQADGGSYKGRRLGSIGHAGGFSFNQFKVLSCGDGGAVVTSDRVCFERMLIYHDAGCIYRPHARELGVMPFAGQNYRMLEIMGAIMNQQLKRLDRMLNRMRKLKKHVVAKLEGHPILRTIKHHDLDGDCGTALGLMFDSEKQMRRFSERMGGVGSPIDSGRHIYCHWEPVMEKRGSHHPKMDPFKMAANRGSKVKYSKDMCPQTLDVLSRTAFLGFNPGMKIKDANGLVRACEKAAKEM